MSIQQRLSGEKGFVACKKRPRRAPDVIALTQSPSRTSLSKSPVEEIGSGSDGGLALEAAGPYGINHTVGAVRCCPLSTACYHCAACIGWGRYQYCSRECVPECH
ncbi:uncharacterized protein PgNI_02940 [Pyricularia grisea]|uniref:Uncharacterized protein n=1 Tax=Pyricularia grisea TaxID=148305 RepID=A0A6P8B9Z1_PYRGI|nr:uncharacterized protein PgNI_02940 [Pyricularia grisea]TLD12634.1 hypothetical protein PgNI_02940 [Pyricularia grisea]